MSTNITNLNEEIVKQKKEMGMQQSKMDQLEKSIKINEQNLATKQTENSDLKKQLESERMIQAQSGESSKKEFNRMITAKETEISEMKNSLKLAEENNQAMAKEVDSLKNSTVSIEEENEKVKSEIQDKIAQITQMANSLEKSTKENKELRNQFALETEQSSKIVTRLRIELRESGKLVEELQSQGNKAKNTEYELLSRLEEAEADLKHAKAKCDQAQSSFAALVADTTRSQADEATLAEAAALRDRMAKMEAQIRRLKEDKEEIAAENTQMASDKMQSLIKHEAEMKTVRNSLTLQISRLKQENAKMQEELNASDDSPDTTLLLEERRRSMAIISGLELKNIDLLSKLESIDVDHLEREVDDIRNSVTEILRTFTGGIRGIIESDLLKIEDLHSIEQRICNRIRAEYDDRIARLQRAYDTLVSTLNGPNQLNDAKTSIQRLKIEQLERNSKLQHSTIEMMSQAMVFMKKKKGGSTSNKSVGE
ncbi:hypothetical protein ECANGB1_624 [Enterospora canceri]|uniref:Uncharacterized protein n=1 Tax=Enterospora canceri TaxID=1081671 RepID=A0A1Y1S4A8_9MICR|nr:hypothetical protein ECANGB1_624 [Enterospora canceri]